MNLKNIKNFKQGVKELTPLQQINATIFGMWGTIIGFVLAFISLGIKLYYIFDWTQFWFFIVIGFGAFLNIIGLIGKKQQQTQLINMEKLQLDTVKEMEGETQ